MPDDTLATFHVVPLDHRPSTVGAVLNALDGQWRVWVETLPTTNLPAKAWLKDRQDAGGSLGSRAGGKWKEHISERQEAGLYPLDDDEEKRGLERFLTHWNDRLNCGDDDVLYSWVEMGLRVCDQPAEDSLCCESETCAACHQFKKIASDFGVYEV